MKNHNTILPEKQKKISGLSSGKIDKYESLTDEEILPLQNKLNLYIIILKKLSKKLKALKLDEKQKSKSIEDIFSTNLKSN